MSEFMETVTVARPRFAAEERVGTLVLQACKIAGKQIDTLRNRIMAGAGIHLDYEKMKGRWPVASYLLRSAAPYTFSQNMDFVALPKGDTSIPQVLAAFSEMKLSTGVVTDDGKVFFELRCYVGPMLGVLKPPYTVKAGYASKDSHLVIQPIAAFIATLDMAGYLEREMLLV